MKREIQVFISVADNCFECEYMKVTETPYNDPFSCIIFKSVMAFDGRRIYPLTACLNKQNEKII